jgi:D-alanyl-D-alanine dipeptidase
MIRSYSFFIYVFYLCTASPKLYAQEDSVANKYGLVVIHTIQSLQKTIQKNPKKEMIDLVRFIPRLAMDMKYTGTDHFLQSQLYDSMAIPYARKPLATALAAVQTELNEQGLGLKIWDAYRPYQVTQQIWSQSIHRQCTQPGHGGRSYPNQINQSTGT